MSKPSVLTQILSAVQSVESKVDNLQEQLNNVHLDDLTAVVNDVNEKVSNIQDMLTGEEPEVPPEIETRRKKK